MDCKKAKHLWHERCDGELTPEQQAALEIHLQACQNCRAHHRQMDGMAAALGRLRGSSQAVGVGTAAAPLAVLRRSRWVSVWRISRVAAALAVVLGAATYLSWQGTAELETAGVTSPSPTMVASATTAFEQPEPASVVLSERSAVQFIPVARETSNPNVHVFVLYETFEEALP
jgi:predicted anti-sigma-YlaC factor YlaD